MEFPYYIHLFGLKLHPHLLFELIAYSAGFQFYLIVRRWWPRREAAVPIEQAMWIIVGCIFGGLAGAKLLAWVESAGHYWSNRHHLHIVLGGKTIVGGLLGGWIGVELVKKRLGVAHSTGDVYVFPLILGMCIGRIGCFLTGLPDHTCGVHTSLPLGVDFGDGPRHPAQLYEIAFLLLLGFALLVRLRSSAFNGELFRLFMLGYLSFRFVVEFIKPSDKPFAGLSAIQIACALGAGWCALSLYRGWKAVSPGRPAEPVTPPLVPTAEAE
jgi:prolipoprotein diacylglyceryltransferase